MKSFRKRKKSLINGIDSSENIVLVAYTLYCLGMTSVAVLLNWPSFIEPVIFCGMLSYWWIHWRRFKNYRFRAFYLSCMALLNFTIYAILAESLTDFLPALCTLAVLLGIYNIAEILYLVVGCTIFLMLYHSFILQTLPFGTDLERSRAILQIVSTFVVEFVTYILIRSNKNSSKKKLEIIRSLQTAEQSKSDFMVNMSHEIRTPINTINGMSEIILREEITNQVREEILQMQTAGRNLLAKVNDILDFTELYTDKASLAEESYNLASTINDVINMAIAQMDREHQELIIDCDPTIPRELYGDEQMIRRILTNFVNNAITYTKEGGIYILISHRKEEYGINLSIKVQDTGIGITDEQLEIIFSSFNQVDTKRNREEGGMGLGLAIAKKMAGMLGGFINVKSVYGEGSEFQLVVPQKVQNDAPFVTVENSDQIEMLAYLNTECYNQIKIRDAYFHAISNMTNELHIRCRISRNLQETKRRLERGFYTHVLLTVYEYKEEAAYFDKLSNTLAVIVVKDRNNAIVFGKHIKVMYKPFYVLSFASLLNGESNIQRQDGSHYRTDTFIAPDASILVVDDNVMNLRVVEGLLRPYKINIFTATSGEEAMQKLQTQRYDLIFMDHMMPKMDGVETTHLIRAKSGKYYQKLPIIALTANAIGGAREMFLTEGFQDFVAKPIDMSVMERVLKRHLPSYKILLSEKNADPLKPVALSKEQSSDDLAFEHIDTQEGLQYCSWSSEDYKDILHLYYITGQEKLPEIKKFFETRQWKDYTILVHALKSTSKGIGADRLSDLANMQESAGKAENEKQLMLHHNEMVMEYEFILNELSKKNYVKQDLQILPTSTALLTDISNEEWNKSISHLMDALVSCEMDAIEQQIDRLSSFIYQEKTVREILIPVEESVQNFDFFGAAEALKEIQKEQR